MEILLEFHDNILQKVHNKFVRFLYEKIDWEQRMLAIRGPRGVGKTTLMLQHLKRNFGDQPEKALYITEEEIDQLPGPFSAMYDYEPVQNEIKQFMESIYGDEDPPEYQKEDDTLTLPEGFIIAWVKVAGRAIVLPVPEDQPWRLGGTEATCTCNGGGSCTAKSRSVGIGSAVWCVSDCDDSCTLKTRGEVNSYSVTTYRY